MKYTKTFRDSILRKVLPPENRSVSSVSKEMGVAVVTINSWLAKLKNGHFHLKKMVAQAAEMQMKSSISFWSTRKSQRKMKENG